MRATIRDRSDSCEFRLNVIPTLIRFATELNDSNGGPLRYKLLHTDNPENLTFGAMNTKNYNEARMKLRRGEIIRNVGKSYGLPVSEPAFITVTSGLVVPPTAPEASKRSRSNKMPRTSLTLLASPSGSPTMGKRAIIATTGIYLHYKHELTTEVWVQKLALMGVPDVGDASAHAVHCWDCTGFYDPDAHNLRGHRGFHPEIIRRIVATANFAAFFQDMARTAVVMMSNAALDGRPPILFTYCKKGRHRSLAFSELLNHCLCRMGVVTTRVHMAATTWHRERRDCGGCAECTQRSAKREACFQQAWDIWRAVL